MKTETRFAVTGTFVNFAIEDGYKIEGFYLNVAGEQLMLKVSKRMRYYCSDLLVPGQQLHVLGKKKVNPKKERIKLKVEEILPATSDIVLKSTPIEVLAPSELPEKGKPLCIRICQKSSCRKRGAMELWNELEAEIANRELGDRVRLQATGCMSKCKSAPNIVMPGKMRYEKVKARSIPEIMSEHFTEVPERL